MAGHYKVAVKHIPRGPKLLGGCVNCGAYGLSQHTWACRDGADSRAQPTTGERPYHQAAGQYHYPKHKAPFTDGERS